MQATDILMNEHRVIEQVLTCLEKLVNRFEAGEGLDHASAWQAVDFFRNFADSCHHGKEESSVFPMLEARGVGCHGGSAVALRQEHQQGRAYIDAMSLALVRGAGPAFIEAARKYTRLLREHIHKEDSCLFPAMGRALSPIEDEELVFNYKKVEKEEMGEGTHADYLALADALADRLGVPKAGKGNHHDEVPTGPATAPPAPSPEALPVFAEELSHEHTSLLTQLGKLVASQEEPTPDHVGQLADRLRGMRSCLRRHFYFEEQGYMGEPLAVAPHLYRTACELLAEHGRMDHDLQMMITAAIAVSPESCVPVPLRHEVKRWVAQVNDHEAREEQLIQQAYNQDVGVED